MQLERPHQRMHIICATRGAPPALARIVNAFVNLIRLAEVLLLNFFFIKRTVFFVFCHAAGVYVYACVCACGVLGCVAM